jgi:hypothetical protein
MFATTAVLRMPPPPSWLATHDTYRFVKSVILDVFVILTKQGRLNYKF